MPDQSLTISIVSGASAQDLADCLTSIADTIKTADPAICIVDNCAPFDVASVAASSCPTQVHIIRNKERQGFAANHNKVLRRIETEFALVLNDDVILRDGAVDEMLRVARETPDAGLVGPTLYAGRWDSPPIRGGGADGALVPPPIKVCLHHLLARFGLAPWTLRRRRDRPHDTRPTSNLSYVSGACALMQRDMLRDTGGFDEGFYMYFEDIDLGYRARAAGWRCLQARSAKVMHREGSSFSPRSWPWILAGARRFARKHHGLCVNVCTSVLVAALGAMVRPGAGGRS